MDVGDLPSPGPLKLSPRRAAATLPTHTLCHLVALAPRRDGSPSGPRAPPQLALPPVPRPTPTSSLAAGAHEAAALSSPMIAPFRAACYRAAYTAMLLGAIAAGLWVISPILAHSLTLVSLFSPLGR